MTVAELYMSVAQLGFEDSLEYEDAFILAANRALLQVARIRPATRLCRIHHKPPKNVLADGSFTPVERSESLIFEAEGAKAYYFEADGNGTAYVEFLDGNEWIAAKAAVELASDSMRFRAYKGFFKQGNEFVSGRVRICFEGEYTYSVRSVAFYDRVYSADEKDIPAYEPFTRYDISDLVQDFLSLAAPPVTDDQMRAVLTKNYDVENGRVLLFPHDTSGIYLVRYVHKPSPIVTANGPTVNEDLIDLDEDLCALLPNLIAAYVYAEDEPQLAEYYLTLYNQQAIQIEQRERSFSSVPIITNGW